MVLTRRTRDRITITLAVLSGIVVLIPSAIAAVMSVFGLVLALF